MEVWDSLDTNSFLNGNVTRILQLSHLPRKKFKPTPLPLTRISLTPCLADLATIPFAYGTQDDFWE